MSVGRYMRRESVGAHREQARFCSPSQKWTLLGLGVFLTFVFGSQASRSSVAPDVATKAIVLATAAICGGVMVWTGLRPVLIADRTGVVVRNLFSTESLSWADIARFRIGRYKLLGAVCVIDLKNGSSTDAFSIQVPNIARGKPVTRESRMVDELNARLVRFAPSP